MGTITRSLLTDVQPPDGGHKVYVKSSLFTIGRESFNSEQRTTNTESRRKGHLINRRTKEFSDEDIQQIAKTYHNWRNPDGDYEDVKGLCASTTVERVAELDYVLTPGRYVGIADEEDDFDFKERFSVLKAEFGAQLEEEARLNREIAENLAKVQIR